MLGLSHGKAEMDGSVQRGARNSPFLFLLPREPFRDQRDVLAAEAEAVGEDRVAALLAGGVGDVVQIALGIGRSRS